jgi:hypothetical protein
MADATTTTSNGSWLSGLGDLMDVIGNAVTTGAGAYATIRTADNAASGQHTAGANGSGAPATQPTGVTTTGNDTAARRRNAILAIGIGAAVLLGAGALLVFSRRRR